MEFKKIFCEEWPMCYVAASLTMGNEVMAAFASESMDEYGAFAVDESGKPHPLWTKPAGCMGIVQVPDTEEFVAIQRFYPIFKSDNTQISWFYKQNGGWKQHVIAELPFVHRIEIAKENGRLYLIASTLCESKAFTDDWSTSGCVAAYTLDVGTRSVGESTVIADGLFKNHGLVRMPGDNDTILVAHDDGIISLTMRSGRWASETLLDCPSSDVVSAQDEEIGIIAPFHGSAFKILRRTDSGWDKLYSLAGEFGHAIWGGKINGRKAYLVGFRAGTQNLYCISEEHGQYITEIVEQGAGAANVTVLHRKDGDCIAAANRETGRCAIYKVL